MKARQLHKITQQQLDSFLSNPAHALLLEGESGVDFDEVIELICNHLVIDKLGAFYVTPSDSNSISIDKVHEIRTFLKNNSSSQQAIIILDAHKMTREAQNSLLKILEEPRDNTTLILTTNSSELLLPTITSRTQKLAVHPLSWSQIKDTFPDSDSAKLKRLYAVFGGRTNLIGAALNNEDLEELELIELVKKVISESRVDRLKHVNELAKDRARAILFCDAALTTFTAINRSKIIRNNELSKSVSAKIQTMIKVQSNLVNNGNIKLNLMLLLDSI